LLPDDDLNLAALLKSPFIGCDEDKLYALAHDRGPRSLWSALQQRADDPVTAWLSSLFTQGGNVSAFLHPVLYQPCPADTRSGLRAVLARLGDDARDPLREILARAETHDRQDYTGLQGFLLD